MKLSRGSIYYINRGNNRQKIFFIRDNYFYFLRKVEKHLTPHAHVLAYCLMPTPFHLMLEVPGESDPMAVSRAIRIILSSYAQGVSKQENRTGSLFQQNTRACNLAAGDVFYGSACFAYIYQNPLRALLLSNLEEWEFSSYQDHLIGEDSAVCAVSRARSLLQLPSGSKSRQQYFYRTIPHRYLALIARA